MHQILHFVNENIIILQVTGAGIGGITVIELGISLGLKILIGAITAAYMIWKWRVEYKKHQKENT